MKILSRTTKCVSLTIGVAAIVVYTGFSQEKKGTATVTIKEKGILMHPGTQLSKADEKALNDALRIYDLSLYKINIYQNGKVVKSQGQLKNLAIDKALLAEEADFAGKARSCSGVQFVVPGDVTLSYRG